MEYKYWNQLDYPAIPYGDGTVASSGCGLCSACMVVENLTDYTFTPAEAVAMADSVGAHDETEATDIPKDPSRTSRSADFCSLPASCFLEIGTDHSI